MPNRRGNSPGPYLAHMELISDRIPDADRFPFNLPAVSGLGKLTFHPKVTFLVGENGAGKSTILEALAVESGLNPEGGSRNFNFSTRRSHSDLADAVRLGRHLVGPADSYFLRAESYYNVASEIERLDTDPGGGRRVIDAYGEDPCTSNRTENRFSRCSSTASDPTVCT